MLQAPHIDRFNSLCTTLKCEAQIATNQGSVSVGFLVPCGLSKVMALGVLMLSGSSCRLLLSFSGLILQHNERLTCIIGKGAAWLNIVGYNIPEVWVQG